MMALLYSFLAMAASACFATLFSAYEITGEAGPERLVQTFPAARRRVARWRDRWSVLETTLLLCSTLTQVAALLLAAHALLPVGGLVGVPLLVAILLIVLAFALLVDILPRVLSESYADRLSVSTLPLVSVLALLLAPVAWPLAHVERRLLAALLRGARATDRPSTEDEIRSLVEQEEDNRLDEDEKDIIRSAIDFGSTVAREIMTPRVAVEALDVGDDVGKTVGRVRASGYSRYPVYEDSVDRVLGFVHVKDLLQAVQSGHTGPCLRELLQATVFVPQTMPINELLGLLRARRIQMAMVVDEYGGTAGLVTMEDILEELIGEIRDEYDRDEVDVEAPSGNAAVFDAATPVDQVNETMGVAIPDEPRYDSIGGFAVTSLGRIPAPGETLELPDCTVTVEEADERRIVRVKIVRNTPRAGPGRPAETERGTE